MKKMNKTTLIIIMALLSMLFAGNASAQITLQCVKPGQELLVKPEGDTLWVINDARMRSVVETGRLYQISKEQVKTLTQKCDTLTEISAQKDSLINILKTDRDYYVTELKSSREDVITAGEMARKYRRRAKLASIGIGIGAALGLVAGYFLFK
ncbi:MAG: hypothetical protein J6T96_12280 [Bacteroidales bacterium]|nr:hypothetical protein [Bacteroidales bacterium]MBO7567350.1 hypothetical protein [Bacteroidales bacterium]MBP5682584.1 hypothetical protein [Bacteroidales bacterium]